VWERLVCHHAINMSGTTKLAILEDSLTELRPGAEVS
jgi:hypothetical protein